MKTRRWRRYTLAMLLAMVIGAVVWYLTVPHPRLNLATWNKIDIGMEKRDVEALVNAAPGDYSSGFRDTDCYRVHDRTGFYMHLVEYLKDPPSFARLQGRLLPLHSSAWWGRHCAFFIFYDEHEKVRAKAFARCGTPPTNRVARFVFWFDSWFEKQEKD